MSKRYPQGAQPHLTFTITDDSTPPALVDAATITLTLHKPDGTTGTYTPTRASTGEYHQDIPATDLIVLGDYSWKLVTTGVVAVSVGAFEVFDPFEVTLITLDDARNQLQIDDHSVDAFLQEWLPAITSAVEQYKHEVVVPRTITDEIEVSYNWRWFQRFRVWSAPLISLVSVVSWDGSVTWDVTQMRASSSGLVRVMAGPRVVGLVDVTYKAGRTVIPENYQQGALVILQHLWEIHRGGSTIQFSGVVGQEDIYDRKLEFDIPHKAKEWLGPPRPVVG